MASLIMMMNIIKLITLYDNDDAKWKTMVMFASLVVGAPPSVRGAHFASCQLGKGFREGRWPVDLSVLG